jgi:hypothetical protein
MSTLTSRPMSLVHIEFQELYERHLCRHSQYGINVIHLLALFGTWFGVYAFLYWLIGTEWVPIALAGTYLAVMLPNLPLRVSAATAAFLGLFLAAVFWLPELPLWAYLPMIPVCYELQSLSHKVFTVERDMTEFNRKYAKGSVLFVILLFYEVALVLNYLVFDPKHWTSRRIPVTNEQTATPAV